MKKSGHSKSKKGNGAKTAIIAVVVVVMVVALGAATFYFANSKNKHSVVAPDGKVLKLTVEQMEAKLNTEVFYTGIKINGIDVSGKSKQEATEMLKGMNIQSSDEIKIAISYNEQTLLLDFSEFGVNHNIEQVVEEAYGYARTGEGQTPEQQLVDRYQKQLLLASQPKDFELSFSVDTEGVSDVVRSVLEPLEQDVKEASVTGFDKENLVFLIEDSHPGVDIDIESAITEVKSAIDNKEYDKVITVSPVIIEPESLKSDLEAAMGKISSTSSKTTGDPDRNTNIRLICETIDGLVLQPGESFDFNEFIGKRTADKGYREAGGIYDGALRQELGGGICQPNTMLFHSVVKADLQVDLRKPHSWPSTYVDTGTDATVTWGGANFQFTNTSEYPIAIHAFYADQKVTVEIFGHALQDGMRIEFIGVVNSSSAPTSVEYVADPTLPIGTQSQERGSHNGINASAYKVYYDAEGNEIRREKAFSSYYPVIRARVRVGVLNTDGTVATIDPATGAVITTETTLPSETPSSDGTPSSETPPTETPPTDAPPTAAPPTEAPPTEAPPTEAPTTEAPPADA